ncbi:MAG: hypothetical protein ACOYYS_19305 [Chloroflexota bacterium]
MSDAAPDPYAQLVAAQFASAVKAQEIALENHTKLEDTRHQATSKDIAEIKDDIKDHEARIRALTESSTQFKLLVALATGGGALGVISLLERLLRP